MIKDKLINLGDYFTQTDWDDVWKCDEVKHDTFRGRYIIAQCVGFKDKLDKPLKDTMYGVYVQYASNYGQSINNDGWPRIVTRMKWSPHKTWFPSLIDELVHRTDYDDNDTKTNVSST